MQRQQPPPEHVEQARACTATPRTKAVAALARSFRRRDSPGHSTAAAAARMLARRAASTSDGREEGGRREIVGGAASRTRRQRRRMDASWPWPARPRSGSDRARAPPPAGAPPPPLDGMPRSLLVPHRRAEAPYPPLLHHAASQPRDPRDVASPREEAPSGCATHAALRLRRPGAATAAGGGGGKGGRRAGGGF